MATTLVVALGIALAFALALALGTAFALVGCDKGIAFASVDGRVRVSARVRALPLACLVALYAFWHRSRRSWPSILVDGRL